MELLVLAILAPGVIVLCLITPGWCTWPIVLGFAVGGYYLIVSHDDDDEDDDDHAA